AARTDTEAFENDSLTVRTSTRLARDDRARSYVHALPTDLARASVPSQPNSTWPRMREPAATVREPALTSPLITPPSSSSTRLAVSMLPSSSPPTTTTLALTWPSRWAPVSRVTLPSTCTSPLKRPAIRTWPEPTILPSMVRSEAMTDSFISRRCASFTAGRRGVSGLRGATLVLSGSRRGGGPDGGGAPVAGPEAGPEFVSFQSAMLAPVHVKKRNYLTHPCRNQCLQRQTGPRPGGIFHVSSGVTLGVSHGPIPRSHPHAGRNDRISFARTAPRGNSKLAT